MSRKRPSRQTNVGYEDDIYEYYSPGCYCTPQVVVQRPTPYCCNHQQDYPIQWHDCNTATYVVDAYGIVYYSSDFEYQLQLPNNLTVETEITYHHKYDKDECSEEIDDDEASVSPSKRERFEEYDSNDSAQVSEENKHINKKVSKSQGGKSNVYRAEQGYLVEERSDSDEPRSK